MSSISNQSSIEELRFLYLDSMPDDLLRPIFSFMPQKFRNNFRLVCKKFLDNIDIDNRVADLAIETFFSKTKPQLSYNWDFTKLSSQLKVAVQVLDFTKNGLSIQMLSKNIAIQFPNILEIKAKLQDGCFTITEKQFSPLQWFSSVKIVTLFGADFPGGRRYYNNPMALSLLPSSIEHLSFTYIDIEEIHFQQFSRFTALKSLMINNVDMENDGILDYPLLPSESFSHLSPTLKKLFLEDHFPDDLRGLSHLTNLKFLYIDAMHNSAGFDKIPQSVTHLGAYQFLVDQLHMLTRLTKLEGLVVSHFYDKDRQECMTDVSHLGLPQWIVSLWENRTVR
jgi:hypothetical protein